MRSEGCQFLSKNRNSLFQSGMEVPSGLRKELRKPLSIWSADLYRALTILDSPKGPLHTPTPLPAHTCVCMICSLDNAQVSMSFQSSFASWLLLYVNLDVSIQFLFQLQEYSDDSSRTPEPKRPPWMPVKLEAATHSPGGLNCLAHELYFSSGCWDQRSD